MLTGKSAPHPTKRWPSPGQHLSVVLEQDAAYNALGHAVRLDLPLDQARWELATSRQRLFDDAIASATAGAGWFVLRRSGSTQLPRSRAHGMDQALARGNEESSPRLPS